MMTSLEDAWHWCDSVHSLTQMMQRLGRKYWEKLPWEGLLDRDEHLRHADAADISDRSDTVFADLDDLCVLLLFSVFESTVRAKVLADINAELPPLQHPTLLLAIQEAKESIENGSFFRVLEPFKATDADLIEQVNQVRRYRNWVAHGRRGLQPAAVDPAAAFDRLQRFVQRINETNSQTSVGTPSS